MMVMAGRGVGSSSVSLRRAQLINRSDSSPEGSAWLSSSVLRRATTSAIVFLCVGVCDGWAHEGKRERGADDRAAPTPAPPSALLPLHRSLARCLSLSHPQTHHARPHPPPDPPSPNPLDRPKQNTQNKQTRTQKRKRGKKPRRKRVSNSPFLKTTNSRMIAPRNISNPMLSPRRAE